MISISIIIAAYNIAPYIARCVRSAIEQSLYNIEIIVVNDCSTDETLKILNEFSNESRLRIVSHKENMGLSIARKTGRELAKGEYLWFVDGDDWLVPNACEKLFEKAKEINCDILCFSMFINTVKEDIYLLEEFGKLSNYEYLKYILMGKIPPSIFCKLIRKDFLVQNKIPSPPRLNCGEDVALSTLLGMFKPNVTLMNKPFIHYCLRNNSLSSHPSKNLLDIYIAIEFIKNYMKATKIYEVFLEEFNYFAFMHCLYYKYFFIFQHISPFSQHLYEIWKTLDINVQNNHYIREVLKEDTPTNRVLSTIGNMSYNDALKSYFKENGII